MTKAVHIMAPESTSDTPETSTAAPPSGPLPARPDDHDPDREPAHPSPGRWGLIGMALGALGVMNPPLRSPADVAAVWANLAVVDMVASDHAPHTLEEKRSANPPAGVPGLETIMPLLVDAALAGKLSLPDVARLSAAGPAAVFGLRHKGRIAAGYHADITLVDPDGETLLGEKLYSKCGWTPFAGRRVRGSIRRVLLRGRDAALDGVVLAQPGWGRFLAPNRA